MMSSTGIASQVIQDSLQSYRSEASFNSKEMQELMESPDRLHLKPVESLDRCRSPANSQPTIRPALSQLPDRLDDLTTGLLLFFKKARPWRFLIKVYHHWSSEEDAVDEYISISGILEHNAWNIYNWTSAAVKVWSYLASNPDYCPSSKVLSSDEEKTRTANLLHRFLSSGLFSEVTKMDYKTRTLYLMTVNEALEMLNPNLSIKIALGVSLCSNALLCLGTERHLGFFNDLWKGKILSCLAITEVAHGSDTKRLRTSATYDNLTNEFVLNTPGIDAAKCWVGNLGRQCTHGLVFAQLIVDDVCHGLHAFIVPIRNPTTLTPYPNLTVGDIGEKDGLHGIDNGYIMFHHYRIPKDNLLDRIGGINENGEYETSFTDPQRVLGAALESLSAGRVAIMQESSNTLVKAIVIAIRYGAQRLQFSDKNGKELPLLEYQTHQWRLFPFVAAAYVFKSFIHDFSAQYINFVVSSREGEIGLKEASDLVKGVHALVCCTKALITWTGQNAIQECREACGGHGYHKAAALGDLRSNHDPRVTFEGDNTVLLQQTSNWLLRLATDRSADFSVYPASEIAFLRRLQDVLKRRFTRGSLLLVTEDFIMETYEWLICYLVSATLQRIKDLETVYKDKFYIKNQSQVFRARSLSLAFAEYMVLSYFLKKCMSSNGSLRPVTQSLFRLYGAWTLYKHIPLLYQGGFCSDPTLVDFISDSILALCSSLKSEVVLLTDVLSPPDFVLNSVLGCYDGKVYERLVSAFNLSRDQRAATPLSPPIVDSVLLKSKM